MVGASAHPPHTEVGLRASLPSEGKGTDRLQVPPSPSLSLSPPQGLAAFRDKGPLRPQTQPGGRGTQAAGAILGSSDPNPQPSPAQAGWALGRNRGYSQPGMSSAALGSHTAHATAHTYTHIRCARCHTHTQRCAYTLGAYTHLHSTVCSSLNIDNTGVCAPTQALAEHLQVLLLPWGGGGWRGESSPLATCWPLSHADDPWLTPEGLGPSSFRKHGMGAGQPRPHAPHMRTHTSNTGASPSPGHLHHRGLEPWSAGGPAARSRRCLAALMGEGNRTGQSSRLPSSLPPGVQSQAAAVPSPLALADNGRFIAGRCCWTTASLWERGGVQPKPQITASGEARRCPCLTPGAVCVHSLGQ